MLNLQQHTKTKSHTPIIQNWFKTKIIQVRPHYPSPTTHHCQNKTHKLPTKTQQNRTQTLTISDDQQNPAKSNPNTDDLWRPTKPSKIGPKHRWSPTTNKTQQNRIQTPMISDDQQNLATPDLREPWPTSHFSHTHLFL